MITAVVNRMFGTKFTEIRHDGQLALECVD